MIRLTIPSIEDEDLRAVSETLATGYLVQGARVKSFEERIAAYTGTKHAAAVSNCTAALHLALLALNIKPGDLVVVSSYSWIATANVIELCGAQPVFVDIDPRTFNMSAEILRETLKKLMSISSTAKRVKAILPVHTFGLMADLDAILQVAGEYSLPVIEDAACAAGSTVVYYGRNRAVLTNFPEREKLESLFTEDMKRIRDNHANTSWFYRCGKYHRQLRQRLQSIGT